MGRKKPLGFWLVNEREGKPWHGEPNLKGIVVTAANLGYNSGKG